MTNRHYFIESERIFQVIFQSEEKRFVPARQASANHLTEGKKAPCESAFFLFAYQLFIDMMLR
jgi:hypothetical protein